MSEWVEVDRFRSRADGTSEFVRARIPWIHKVTTEDGGAARLSETFASPNVKLLELPGGLAQEAHPAPEPQIVIVLSGRIEVETTGDRQVKSWGAGEFFIAGDHDGIGHLTRVPEGPVTLMFVPLDPDKLDSWTVR
jgi:quercetin dioxygenase-like cupin family protein